MTELSDIYSVCPIRIRPVVSIVYTEKYCMYTQYTWITIEYSKRAKIQQAHSYSTPRPTDCDVFLVQRQFDIRLFFWDSYILNILIE